MLTAFATFTFEAAHRLPLVPEGHKCGRLHGHNWTVEIHCAGVPDERGWIVDFYAIERAWRERVYDVVDHRLLNEIDGGVDAPELNNPTTENIVRWIWRRIKPELSSLARVVVRETPMFGASYDGQMTK